MSWWSIQTDPLTDLFGRPGVPKPPPPLPSPRYCRVSVFAAAGGLAPVIGGTLSFDDPTWDVLIAEIEGGRLKFTLPKAAQYGWQVHLKAHTADQDGAWDVVLQPDIDVAMGPARPPTRTGVVTLVGKSWTDAGGPYYPLGDSLLYALGHWHRGGALRDLVKENLAFIASYGHDYVRILGQVNWTEGPIDPTWPNYEQELAELIDCAYDEHGLRVKVTAIGGGAPDPQAVAAPIHRVVAAGRQHKIQLLEAVNEQNADAEEAIAIAEAWKDLGVPVSTGRGNAGIDNIKQDGDAAQATVDIFHTERGLGDADEPGGEHARQVRQARDFIHFRRASEDGEPPGPASSVATLDDPYHLATKRVANIVQGGGAFCLHTGSGVFGKTYQSNAGMRYARLADIPNIDAIMTAVRNADLRLPKGCENWAAFNANQPIAHLAGNANKLFGCKSGNQVVEVLIGCDGVQTFKASSAMTVDAYNIATGESIGHHEMAVLQPFQHEGLWAYLLIGETH